MALTPDQITLSLNTILSGLASSASDFNLLKDTLTRKFVRVSGITDAGTAATDIVERAVWSNNTNGNLKLIAVTMAFPVAITSSDSVPKIFTFKKRPVSAPGTPATVVACDTSATGGGSLGTTPLGVAWTKCTAPAGAYTAANVIFAPNDIMTFTMTHTSTGTAVSASGSEIDVQLVFEPSP